ncbi:cyclase family protein [Desulfoplanes sp.]
MHVIDLTRVLHSNIPVFPGTPPVRITTANTVAEHGFEERLLSMSSHTGTHMDNPSHILAGRPGLDTVPPDRFIGPGCLLDVRGKTEITREELCLWEPVLEGADFVLLWTGWEEKWGEPTYFSGFPALTEKAARYLTRFNLKGIGVDAISIDRMEDGDLPVHHVLLGQNVLIVENLTTMGRLPQAGFTFMALPLKIKDGDGSPVRALAVIG